MEDLKKFSAKFAIGAGGKLGGGGAKEAPDSLKSIQKLLILDLLSEGQIEGFVYKNEQGVVVKDDTMAKGIFLNRVPLSYLNSLAANDVAQSLGNVLSPVVSAPEVSSVAFAFTPGTPTQGCLQIGAAPPTPIGSPVAYAREIRKNNGGVTVPFGGDDSNPIDELLIEIRTGNFYHIDKDNGDVKGTLVDYHIALTYNDDDSVQDLGDFRLLGKTRDFFERTHSCKLEVGHTGGGVVTITRKTDDAPNLQTQNTIYLQTLTEVQNVKLTYPNCALVAMCVDSVKVTNISDRLYYVRGIRVRVPANYDPENRVYATSGTGTTNGVWNGTFKTAWTNNPAWIYYDLLTNPRYGLGKYMCSNPQAYPWLQQYYVDKWSLYSIGQYCDALVDDGDGGEEPRFTCNVYVRDQEEAYALIQKFASIFRGIVYWSAGTVTTVQDRDSTNYTEWNSTVNFSKDAYCVYKVRTYRSLQDDNQCHYPDQEPAWWVLDAAPIDSVMHFVPANVKDGQFTYVGSAKKARHTAAVVAYFDPDDFFVRKYQYVEDQTGIEKFGLNVLDTAAYACTSRSQAYRVGKWALLTELYETDTVQFTAGHEANLLRPGHIVAISNPLRNNQRRMGGRLLDATTSVLTLDSAVTLEANKDYFIYVIDPEHPMQAETNKPEIEALNDLIMVGTIASDSVERSLSTITLETPLKAAPQKGTVWAIACVTARPEQFKVLTISEIGTGEFTILAIKYMPGKYSAIEHDLDLGDLVASSLPNPFDISAPTEVTILGSDTLLPETGQIIRRLNVHWQPSTSPSILHYEAQYSIGDGMWYAGSSAVGNDAAIDVVFSQEYYVRVRALNSFGQVSPWSYSEAYTLSDSLLSDSAITGLEIEGQGNVIDFAGRDPKFVWRVNSPDTAQEVSDNASGKNNPLVQGYIVRIVNPGGVIVRENTVTTPEFVYRFQDNLADNGNNPLRSFTIKVAAVDRLNHVTKAAELAVTNPAPFLGPIPPITTGLRVSTQNGNLALNYDRPTDASNDFEGVLVFLTPVVDGEGTLFDSISDLLEDDGETLKTESLKAYSDGGCLVYRGAESTINIPLPGGPYKLVIAPFDSFGYDALNYYGPIDNTVDLTIDSIPPNAPVLFGLRSRNELTATGESVVILSALFEPNTEDDLDVYQWSLREVSLDGSRTAPDYTAGVGDYHGVPQLYKAIYGSTPGRVAEGGYVKEALTGEPDPHPEFVVRVEWTVKPNTGYEVQLAAVDKSGNVSAWTTLASAFYLLTTLDAQAPSAPTDVVAVQGLHTVFLTWTNCLDSDLAFVRVYQKVHGASDPSDPVASIYGTSISLSGLAVETVYDFWLTSVDTSGNESAHSEVVSGTPASVVVDSISAEHIYAGEGLICDLQITSTGKIRSGTTSYSTLTHLFSGQGFYLDAQSNLLLGDAAGAHIEWNAFTSKLSLVGAIEITQLSTLVSDGRVKGPVNPQGNPSTSGLYLGADALGYYDATVGTADWTAVIMSNGTFRLGKSTDSRLTWANGLLSVVGEIIASSGKIGSLMVTEDALSFASGNPTFKNASTWFYLQGLFDVNGLTRNGLRFSLGDKFWYQKEGGVDSLMMGPILIDATKITIGAGASRLGLDANGLWFGGADFSAGVLKVTPTGVLTVGTVAASTFGVSSSGIWFGAADWATAAQGTKFRVSNTGAVFGSEFITTTHIANQAVTKLYGGNTVHTDFGGASEGVVISATVQVPLTAAYDYVLIFVQWEVTPSQTYSWGETLRLWQNYNFVSTQLYITGGIHASSADVPIVRNQFYCLAGPVGVTGTYSFWVDRDLIATTFAQGVNCKLTVIRFQR
jgi:predicted phage tail protein